MKACWTGCCLVLALVLAFSANAGDGGKKFKGDIEAFFKKLDSNMDGRLSKDEFLKMAERAKEKEQARQKLGQAYDKLDPEMKGLTKDVFKRFLENGKNAETPPNKSKT